MLFDLDFLLDQFDPLAVLDTLGHLDCAFFKILAQFLMLILHILVLLKHLTNFFAGSLQEMSLFLKSPNNFFMFVDNILNKLAALPFLLLLDFPPYNFHGLAGETQLTAQFKYR